MTKKHTLKLKRKPSTNEWMVVWLTNGRRNEDRTGYFDDKEDAMSTMKHMQAQADELNRLEAERDKKLYLVLYIVNEEPCTLWCRARRKPTREEVLKAFEWDMNPGPDDAVHIIDVEDSAEGCREIFMQ